MFRYKWLHRYVTRQRVYTDVKATAKRRPYAKILIVRYSIAAMVTDLWRHPIYNEKSCYSRTIIGMLPEINTM